jgi:hypothetical protein
MVFCGYIEHFLCHPGPAGDWYREELSFRLGPWWTRYNLYHIPVVSLTSIQTNGAAPNAGWAVDECDAHQYEVVVPSSPGVQIMAIAHLAVRDVGECILRVNYHVTAVGQLVTPAPQAAALPVYEASR